MLGQPAHRDQVATLATMYTPMMLAGNNSMRSEPLADLGAFERLVVEW